MVPREVRASTFSVIAAPGRQLAPRSGAGRRAAPRSGGASSESFCSIFKAIAPSSARSHARPPCKSRVQPLLVVKVDARAHRARYPPEGKAPALRGAPRNERLSKEVRDESPQRLALLPPQALEVPQDGLLDIDRRSRHDRPIIWRTVSDVYGRPSPAGR